jgi:uncharacterized protein (UPF0333 family)
MFYLRTKGQSTLEYVILLGFVVAALIAMGVYMKRGVSGKLRDSTDQIGEQYEAGKTTGKYTIVSNMAQNETLAAKGVVTTDIQTNKQERSGNETVVGLGTQ